jgi:hypothetical protein
MVGRGAAATPVSLFWRVITINATVVLGAALRILYVRRGHDPIVNQPARRWPYRPWRPSRGRR